MCHDINPLGTTMHLKELDRLAARHHCLPASNSRRLGAMTLRIVRAVWQHARAAAAIVAAPRTARREQWDGRAQSV